MIGQLVKHLFTVGVKNPYIDGRSKMRRPSGPSKAIEREHRDRLTLGCREHNLDPTIRHADENLVTVSIPHHDQTNFLQQVSPTGCPVFDTYAEVVVGPEYHQFCTSALPNDRGKVTRCRRIAVH